MVNNLQKSLANLLLYVFILTLAGCRTINNLGIKEQKENIMVPEDRIATDANTADFNQNNADLIELIKNKSINVVAPAYCMDKDLLSKLQALKALRLDFSNSVLDGSNANIRFESLKKALLDDSTDVIWTLRGGFGSAELIPFLQTLPRPQKEKYFIGYSDITALHLFLTQQWGWKTIHGSMIAELPNLTKDRQNFVKVAKIIAKTQDESIVKNLLPLNDEARQSKLIQGKLTGGNLCLVQTSLGTDWQINATDKILFLESLGYKPRQLKRALLHLKQAKVFDKVKGVVFGSLSGDEDDLKVRDKNKKDDWEEQLDIVKAFVPSLTVSIFQTDRFGHESLNDPLIYNTAAEIRPNHNNNFDLIMNNV